MRTAAVLDGDEWVIDGAKELITRLDSDFYVVFAVTTREAAADHRFVVERRPGFSVEASTQARDPRLADRLAGPRRRGGPARERDGEVGKGIRVALGTLERTRLGAAAQAVGIAQGADRLRQRLRQGASGLRQADQPS